MAKQKRQVAESIPRKMGSVGGFKCTACGEAHMFSGYVSAHWYDELVHTCECGAKHIVHAGTAVRLNY